MHSKEHQHTQASIAIIIAAVIWGTGGIAARALPFFSLNIYVYSTLIAIGSVLTTTVYCYARHISLRTIWNGARSFHGRLFITGLCNLLINYLIQVAYQGAPLGTVTFLLNLAPVYTLILGALFLRESISRTKIISLLLALAGIAFITELQLSFFGTGVIYAVLVGLVVATDYCVMRSLHSIPFTTTVWWRSFYLMVCSIPMSVIMWRTPDLAHPALFAVLIVWVSVFMLGLGNALYGYASKILSAGRISLLRMIDIVVATVIGFAVFSEMPPLTTIIGGILIIASSLNLVFSKKLSS